LILNPSLSSDTSGHWYDIDQVSNDRNPAHMRTFECTVVRSLSRLYVFAWDNLVFLMRLPAQHLRKSKNVTQMVDKNCYSVSFAWTMLILLNLRHRLGCTSSPHVASVGTFRSMLRRWARRMVDLCSDPSTFSKPTSARSYIASASASLPCLARVLGPECLLVPRQCSLEHRFCLRELVLPRLWTVFSVDVCSSPSAVSDPASASPLTSVPSVDVCPGPSAFSLPASARSYIASASASLPCLA
ncbi:hypothetical protein KCU89_g109, partial [Aureobasidium melanogenum]